MQTNRTLAPTMPMPAPARVSWVSARADARALSLSPADVAELDPMGTGEITVFGVRFYAPAAPVSTLSCMACRTVLGYDDAAGLQAWRGHICPSTVTVAL